MKIFIVSLLTFSSLLGAIGEVTAIIGDAQIQRESKILTVERGLDIELKDRLETEHHSKVQVIMSDETVITIGPRSSYSFERYQEGSTPIVEMRLQRGFFKIVTGKIGKIAPERFKVKTEAATIGIRGTQFMATVQKERESIACSKGALIIETQERNFELPAGMMLVYENQHWRMQEMDTAFFTPLLAEELPADKTPLEKSTTFLPDFRDSYTPMEQQMDKEHWQ